MVVTVAVAVVVMVEIVRRERAYSGFELMPCTSSAGWRTKLPEMIGRVSTPTVWR